MCTPTQGVWQPAGCVSCEPVCVCVSLVRAVIICPASTHTALVSCPSLAVLHLPTYTYKLLPAPVRRFPSALFFSLPIDSLVRQSPHTQRSQRMEGRRGAGRRAARGSRQLRPHAGFRFVVGTRVPGGGSQVWKLLGS